MVSSRPLSFIQTRTAHSATALGIAIASGALGALTMPYGPATTLQALVILLGGLALGVASGRIWYSRWSYLAVPLAHIAAIELTRVGLPGATVGPIRLDTLFGVLAFVLGRGVHGLIGIVPLVIGIGLGAAWARARLGTSRRVNWFAATVSLLYPAGLMVALLLPASTPPIIDAAGAPVSGSIAELTTIAIGGHEQTLMIRGHSVTKPVLLYLSGGPGQSDLPFPRVLFADLTRDFVVVGWDQRGTGKSYGGLHPATTLTLDQAVEDTIAVTNYLRERFDQPKIYLLGESWGSTLGVLAAQRRPDLYYAVIGSGQMVSQRETDRRLYADMLALAERNGDRALAEQMKSFGEPPYADIPYAYGVVMTHYEELYAPYTPPQSYIERGAAANVGMWGIMGSEYSLIDRVNVLRGLLDMFTVLYPQLQQIDFRRDVPRLETPIYILDGAAELRARRDLMLEWYEMLDAPIKRRFTFENAGHAVAFEQYEAFHTIMNEVIVPETYPAP